jgi:hypothetical protein
MRFSGAVGELLPVKDIDRDQIRLLARREIAAVLRRDRRTWVSLSGTPWDKPLSGGLGKDSGNWRRKLRISEICVFILSTKWRCEPHLGLAIWSLVKRKITKFTRYRMDVIHHKEFETIPGRTTDGVSVSPLVARLRLQNAAPKGSSTTCFGLPEACQRNEARVRSLWSTVRALFRDLFSTPSNQDLKPTPGVSVILTPVGLLVYQWQIDDSAANPQKSRGLGRRAPTAGMP